MINWGSDPYSASKASAEIIVKSYLESFYLKIKRISNWKSGNVIGGGDWSPNRLIPDCVKWITKNKLIYLEDPTSIVLGNMFWNHYMVI